MSDNINEYNSSFDIVKTIAEIQQAVNTVGDASADITDDTGTVAAPATDYTYNRIRTFYANSAPAGLNMTTDVGTVWVETDNNNNQTWWDGITFQAIGTQRWHGGLGLESLGPAMIVRTLSSLRLYENTTPGSPAMLDMKYTTGTNVLEYWNGSAWVVVTDVYLKSAAATALNFGDIPPADTYIKIWYQSATPTAEGIGDLWYDSSNDFAARRWDGAAWVAYGGDARTNVGFPPATATITLRASASALTIFVTNADGADDTTYDYHMSTTSGFTPTTGTLVDSTLSTINVLTRDAAGVLLQPVQPYYIKVIARNSAGAAAVSNEVTGQLDLTVNNQLIVDQVSTGFLLAGTIQIGGANFILDADDGLIINQTDGSVIHFPRDGSPATITAHLIARSLLVENGANIQGESLLGGTIRLGADVENPDTAPTITQDYEVFKDLQPSIAGLGVVDAFGPVRNAANNGWVVLACTKPGGDYRNQTIIRLDITDAGAVTNTSMTIPVAGHTNLLVKAFTKVGTDYHVAGYPITPGGGFATSEVIVRLNSSWVVQAYRSLSDINEGASSSSSRYGLFYDGTNLRLAYSKYDRDNGFDFSWAYYDLKECVFSPTYTSGTTGFISRQIVVNDYIGYADRPMELVGYYRGNADYGSLRYILQPNISGATGGYYHGTLAYTAPDTRSAVNDWTRFAGTGGNVYESGMWWDGTNFWGLAADRIYGTAGNIAVCKIVKLAPNPATATMTASYSWQNDAGTITTAQSPAASQSWIARSRYTVAAQAAPQVDSVAADAANSIAIYADVAGAGRKQQTQLAIGIKSYTSGVVSTGGVNAPTSNGFAGIGTPGLIRSTKTDVNGPLVSLKGDGSGRIGPFYWSASGAASAPYDTGWIFPVLGAGWTAVGGWPTPAYRRIGGVVYMRGPVAGGTAGQACYFLPTGFQPPANQTFIVSSSAAGSPGLSRLQIRNDGAVYTDINAVGGAGSFFFTDCSFVCS